MFKAIFLVNEPVFTDLSDFDKAAVKVPFVSKNEYLLPYGTGTTNLQYGNLFFYKNNIKQK